MATNRTETEWRYTTSLLLLQATWRRLARETLSREGFPAGTASILSLVARRGDGVRQGAVAAESGIGGPALVRAVDRLVRDGLLVRKEDPADRRHRLLFLTPRSLRLTRRMQAALAPLRQALLARVGDADLAAALRVADAFEAVARRLETDRRKRP